MSGGSGMKLSIGSSEAELGIRLLSKGKAVSETHLRHVIAIPGRLSATPPPTWDRRSGRIENLDTML